MRPAAFCLPHKYCKYEKGRAQHFSRQPKRLGRILAATRLGPRGRSASQGIRTNADGRAVNKSAWSWRKNGRSSFLNPALRGEIDREAAEPVAAFVMFTGHRSKPCAPKRFCCAGERWTARIISRERREDAFQHPRSTQI